MSRLLKCAAQRAVPSPPLRTAGSKRPLLAYLCAAVAPLPPLFTHVCAFPNPNDPLQNGEL